ncbi:MAG: ABC transporter permease [Cyclobacteriaceae bacterium]|nr:ABC transporter permease [Cyclobacteriaceae bacterium]
MLLNHLKLALRLLVRSPFFTFINVLGLSVGVAAFLILWQHATSELKMDQSHKDYKRMARIGGNWNWNEEGQVGHITWGNIMAHQFNMILSDFSEIEDHTRFILEDSKRVSVQKNGERKLYNEARIVRADPNLFDFFAIPLIYGDIHKALQRSNAVALSRRTAIKYFGEINPVDQLLTIDDSTTLVVSAVFEDLPHTTHLEFDLVLSSVGREREWDEPVIFFTQCYVKLNREDGFQELTSRINGNTAKYWEAILKMYPQGWGDIFAQPLEEIAFSNFSGDWFEPRSRFSLVILGIVAVLILTMAWINCINLTISRTTKRLKEIATRKVSGALTRDFLKQFMIESLVTNLLAIACALTAIQLIREPLHSIFNIQIMEPGSIPPGDWILPGLFVCSGIIITALYPAFMSASYSPRSLLSFHTRPSTRSVFPALLTTVQYAAAFALISWGFIMYAQLNFILHKDLGIDKANVVILDAPNVKSATYEADFHFFLSQISRLHEVTYSHSVFRDIIGSGFRMKRPNQEGYKVISSNGGIDETFIPFYKIKLLAGRNFRPNDRDDAIIISRYAAERLSYKGPEDALGGRIKVVRGISDPQAKPMDMEIIGVIEDYRLTTFKNFGGNDSQEATGSGICLTFKNAIFRDMVPERISIRLPVKNVEEQMAKIESVYKKVFPGSVANWYFLDDRINEAYNQEKISNNQIALFTVLAIGIACLGLLGMISNKVEEKTKEIGIRKVLGAGIRQIGSVLLQTTLRQVVAAVLLSMPVAYYLGGQYLEQYTERIELQWWHFAAPVILLLLILFTTISSVLWRAARSNPVEALKYE